MTLHRTPGRHRRPGRTMDLIRPQRTAAVVLVAATGLGASNASLSDAAQTHVAPTRAARTPPAAGASVDGTAKEALAMLRELQPAFAAQAAQTRRLGRDLTRQAEAATSDAKTRRQKEAAAALAKRARHARALGRELTAQAEAMAHAIPLVARFSTGARPTGTVAQLTAQAADADAAEAYLLPLAATAKKETRAELTAARAAVAKARTDAARRKAKSRLAQAKDEAALAQLFVRVADIVRVETARLHAAVDAATPSPAPTWTPSPTRTPSPEPTVGPTPTPVTSPPPVTAPMGGASPVEVPPELQ